MRNVVIALLPVCLFAIYTFGSAVALVLAAATASCVVTEHVLCKTAGQPSTIGDWSVAITGLLYGLTLPPDLPLWMVAVGGIFAVAVGKFLFGGLGSNAFNPALVGRAFLQAAFPQAMTHWAAPLAANRFVDLPASTLALPFAQPFVTVLETFGWRSARQNPISQRDDEPTILQPAKIEGVPLVAIDEDLGVISSVDGLADDPGAFGQLAPIRNLAPRRRPGRSGFNALVESQASLRAAHEVVDPDVKAPALI